MLWFGPHLFPKDDMDKNLQFCDPQRFVISGTHMSKSDIPISRRVDRIRAKLQGMGTFTFDYTFDTCPGVKTLYQVQVKVPPKNNVLASPMGFLPTGLFAIEDCHSWFGNLLFLCLLTKEQYQSRIHKPHEYEVRHYQLDLPPSESTEVLYCSW